MVLNISHSDKKKYLESRKKKKIKPRVRRTSTLSQKVKADAFKQFEAFDTNKTAEESISIDEHVKMNDNFMRTGPYKAKKK
jgi:hypothetical protein